MRHRPCRRRRRATRHLVRAKVRVRERGGVRMRARGEGG